jgi:hypothetical protein
LISPSAQNCSFVQYLSEACADFAGKTGCRKSPPSHIWLRQVKLC